MAERTNREALSFSLWELSPAADGRRVPQEFGMIPTMFPLADLLTARSLAALAAAYPAIVASACRRQDAPLRWAGPVDRELEQLMQERPVGAERRVA